MVLGIIVLIKDDLRGVAHAIQLGEKTMSKIRQNLFWALAFNVSERKTINKVGYRIATLNSKERVKVTFGHEEPDRVPVFEQEIASNIASQILGRHAYTGSGGIGWRETVELVFQHKRDFLVDRLCQDLVELHEGLGMDVVRAPLVPEKGAEGPKRKLDEYTYYYEDEESRTWSIQRYEPRTMMFSVVDSSYRREGVPAVERLVHKIEDEEIELEKSAYEAMEVIVGALGRERAITTSSGIGIPLESSWLRVLYDKPELVETYLRYLVKREKTHILESKRIGIDFVLGGGDIANNSGPFYSPSIIRRFILPRLEEITGFCHELGLAYVYRTDGNIWPIANELFIESGVDGYGEIDAQAGMRLGDLKRRLPNLVLWGNIDCAKTLVLGSKEDATRETIEAIKEAAAGGGYILGSSNTIHPTVKLENFLAMLDAARRYGEYPIERRSQVEAG